MIWPALGGIKARENFHQRRFAGAIVADDAQHFAAIEMEVDVAQRGDGAKIFDDPPGFEKRSRRLFWL